MKGPFRSIEEAAKDFKKKFTDKTRNKWEDRAEFTPVAGKYTLLEMDDDDDDDVSNLWYMYITHRSDHGNQGAWSQCL